MQLWRRLVGLAAADHRFDVVPGMTSAVGPGLAPQSPPAKRRSDVLENRFDHMRVVGNAQLVGDGQQ